MSMAVPAVHSEMQQRARQNQQQPPRTEQVLPVLDEQKHQSNGEKSKEGESRESGRPRAMALML